MHLMAVQSTLEPSSISIILEGFGLICALNLYYPKRLKNTFDFIQRVMLSTFMYVSQGCLHVLSMIFLKVLYTLIWHCTLTILLRWLNSSGILSWISEVSSNILVRMLTTNHVRLIQRLENLGDMLCKIGVLLRILPILMGDKIENPGDNEIWQLVFREDVELICAPAISTGQIAHLRVLVHKYLHCRKQAFPYHSLEPKHHFVGHYPAHCPVWTTYASMDIKIWEQTHIF